jgi:hypothetical protein
MGRVVLLLGAVALAGCQAQNPYAAFGPPRVPAPTTSQSLPYYPPSAGAAALQGSGASASAASTRMNVSAEGQPSIQPSRAGLAADPADREPIRVVENAAGGTRTASAAGRATAEPTNNQPTSRPPSGSAGANQSTPPRQQPPGAPQLNYAPTEKSPSLSRMRGFFVAQPAKSDGTAGFRSDPAVAPAAFQQAAPTFVEAPAAAGQWRAR